MEIDHVHFFVEDALAQRDWFVETLGFQAIATAHNAHSQTAVVRSGDTWFLVSSPLTAHSPVADYLTRHPPGVADVAIRVEQLQPLLEQAARWGATILQPLQQDWQEGQSVRWAAIAGWGDWRHTLVEAQSQRYKSVYDHVLTLPWFLASGMDVTLPAIPVSAVPAGDRLHPDTQLLGIDHVVLNVPVGELERAIAWYEAVLGLQRQQRFSIQTQQSGLCSQVLGHPNGSIQLPINEPASANSQIQEFLDINRGAGVQHIALRAASAVAAIAHLRQLGLAFLSVPTVYYDQLRLRPGFPLSEPEWRAIAHHQILADWQSDNPHALLLQAFTQPIFAQPTFFFEIIERKTYCTNQQVLQAKGFGEGNFLALFQAIELEQMKRQLDSV